MNRTFGSKRVTSLTIRCGMPQRRPWTVIRDPNCKRSGPSTRRRCNSGGDTRTRLAGRLKKSKISTTGRGKQSTASKSGIGENHEIHERHEKRREPAHRKRTLVEYRITRLLSFFVSF